ncbi:hypothetical protein K449DRAFT_435081 [Hypoxylon sp. EC38]|nr:hypothetical protein K449DRAFT_435081 [Hypoxylon sp. EC38]
MDFISPLPFLVAPTTEQATHDVILLHSFKNNLGKREQATKCREVLKSQVLNLAKPIQDLVNVRVFVFDSAHILHHRHVALSEAVTELSKRIEATSKEPSSPLFRQEGEDGGFDPGSLSSSQAAVFVAHGLGTSLDLRIGHFLLEYFRELSTLFRRHGEDAKLSEINVVFRRLTDSRYGKCEAINEGDVGG